MAVASRRLSAPASAGELAAGGRRSGSGGGWLLVLPALVLVLVLLAYPIALDVWLSLTNARDSLTSGLPCMCLMAVG